jgi:hypothetical protein
MGSIRNWMWIQNDGKGKTLEQGNNWPYYRSRLRAMAFSTAYSFQWKLGPFGEARAKAVMALSATDELQASAEIEMVCESPIPPQDLLNAVGGQLR